MTVLLTGRDLTIDEVARVARRDDPVELSPEAVARMRASRNVVDRALASGAQIYGFSTGLGVLKRDPAPADAAALARFNRRLIGMHRTAQGPEFARDVVRSSMLRMANHFALGTPGVRPELAALIVDALNEGYTPPVRMLGSVGQADLTLTADLAHGLLAHGGFTLAPGEGLALLNNNAISTGSSWRATRTTSSIVRSRPVSTTVMTDRSAQDEPSFVPASTGTVPRPEPRCPAGSRAEPAGTPTSGRTRTKGCTRS